MRASPIGKTIGFRVGVFVGGVGLSVGGFVGFSVVGVLVGFCVVGTFVGNFVVGGWVGVGVGSTGGFVGWGVAQEY